MAKDAIRKDEWLAELARVQETAGDEGLTVEEIAEKVGHSKRWVRRRLTSAKKAGRLQRGTRMAEDLGGRMQPVPVYRITKEKA